MGALGALSVRWARMGLVPAAAVDATRARWAEQQEDVMALTEVASELVANVLSIDVVVGQEVREGDALVILESMKMEIPVLAPHDGVVAAIRTAAGDVVQDGDVMVVVQG